jgi:hypothetical protein
LLDAAPGTFGQQLRGHAVQFCNSCLDLVWEYNVNLESQYSKPVEEPRRKRWVTSKPRDDASVSSGGPHSHVTRKEMSDGSQV